MNRLIQFSIVLFLFIGSNFTAQALEVTLSSNREVHLLDIETKEDVLITTTANAILTGRIATNGNIEIRTTLTGASLVLAPELQISGLTQLRVADIFIVDTRFARVISQPTLVAERVFLAPRGELITRSIDAVGDVELSGIDGSTVIEGGATISAPLLQINAGDGDVTFNGSLNIERNVFVITNGDIDINGDINTGEQFNITGPAQALRISGSVLVNNKSNSSVAALLLANDISIIGTLDYTGSLQIEPLTSYNQFGDVFADDLLINDTSATTQSRLEIFGLIESTDLRITNMTLAINRGTLRAGNRIRLQNTLTQNFGTLDANRICTSFFPFENFGTILGNFTPSCL